MNRWSSYWDHYLSQRLTCGIRTTLLLVALIIFWPLIVALLWLCFPIICLVTILMHLKWRFQCGEEECRDVGPPPKDVMKTSELLERYLDDQLSLVGNAIFHSMD